MISNTRTQLESLVEAATRAPSGDNTQPWRFEIREKSNQILIHLDESRDTSPMNAGQPCPELPSVPRLRTLRKRHAGILWKPNVKSPMMAAKLLFKLAGLAMLHFFPMRVLPKMHKPQNL